MTQKQKKLKQPVLITMGRIIKDYAIITTKKGLTGVTTKKLYKGTLNWFGEVHTFYTHATSLGGARILLFKQLADKLSYEFSYVSSHLAIQDNYNIEEVKKNELGTKDTKVQEKRCRVQQPLFPGTAFEDT